MKLRLLTILGIFLFSNSMLAQDELVAATAFDGDIYYGFKAGLNNSNIDTSNLSGSLEDSRFGTVAGFFLGYPLSERWDLQFEFMYSAQGNKEEALRADYLQLPVLIKLNIGEVLYLNLGPQVGIKIWSFEDGYNTFDYSALGGIGLNLGSSWVLDARYSIGFAEMFDDSEPLRGIEGNNKYFQVTLGYKI